MSEQHITSRATEVSELEMVRGTRRVLSLLAGKWSVEVLYLLASGTRRYSEVLYEVGEISKKTLTQTLRALTLPVAQIQSFDDLAIPFRAIATDIVTGDRVVLDHGDLTTAMRASRAAPSAGPYSPPREKHSVRRNAAAMMRPHAAERAPPPTTVNEPTARSQASSAASPSASAKAMPSSAARATSPRVVAPSSPNSTPHAEGSLCGVRSPSR